MGALQFWQCICEKLGLPIMLFPIVRARFLNGVFPSPHEIALYCRPSSDSRCGGVLDLFHMASRDVLFYRKTSRCVLCLRSPRSPKRSRLAACGVLYYFSPSEYQRCMTVMDRRQMGMCCGSWCRVWHPHRTGHHQLDGKWEDPAPLRSLICNETRRNLLHILPAGFE